MLFGTTRTNYIVHYTDNDDDDEEKEKYIISTYAISRPMSNLAISKCHPGPAKKD